MRRTGTTVTNAPSGTTAATAIGNGRWAWGCELDRRNLALIEDRVGPLIYHQGDIVTVTNEEAAPGPGVPERASSPRFRAGTPRWDRPAGERTTNYPPEDAA